MPLAEFGSEALPERLEQLDWLARVARAHEGVLEAALQTATIVPLRLCTIYRDDDGVRRMLASERPALESALAQLEGRQEWGVKLLVDPEALRAAARDRSPRAAEPQPAGGGAAYMARRRMERELREQTGQLVEDLARDVHARLQDWASGATVNRPQNRQLSRHEGEMVLNGAYLVETEKVARLHELVDELRERHRQLGARLELTGPWPPYNFVEGPR